MLTWQFSTTASLGAEAIRLYQHGWPSHVDTVLADGQLLGALPDRYGDIPPGVQIRPPDYAKWTQVQRISVAVSDAHQEAYFHFLGLQLGKPYDMKAVVAFALDRNWREPDAWFCSELTAAASEASWLAHPLANVANTITPRDWLLITSAWAA